MPLFYNFSKSGPGVPDEDNRSRIVIFFDIYTRKFTKFILLNFMNLLFNLPAIAIAYILSANFVFTENQELQSLNTSIMFIVTCILVCIPLITVGPFQAGFTYIMRNFAREEHAFIWSDFFEHTKKNLKQGIIVSLIDLIIVFILLIEIKYFGTNHSFINSVTFWVNIFVFMIYSMMHMYIYQMMVTIDLSVLQLYKNALIFALINFLKNLLIYIICIIIIVGLSLIPVLGYLFMVLILISSIGFIINYHAYATVKKYLIDPIQQKEENKFEQEANLENSDKESNVEKDKNEIDNDENEKMENKDD
jgi:uncharacterized membrane protein YesL